MRLLIGLLLFTALAAGEVGRLHELADTRQLFLLREALQQPGWNKAETRSTGEWSRAASGRNGRGSTISLDSSRAIRHPIGNVEAYEELAAALARQGRYGEAARNMTEAFRLTPPSERTDNANKQDLYAALADIPPQSVAFGEDVPVRATFNELGSWNVPVDVNGRRGQWIFDTGANWSTLSAGEAERLGLETRESDAYVGGSTGKRNALRLAVASDLRIGRAHLKHVIFLVLSDDSLFMGPLKYQIRGILGLPVIRALGRVGIAANGDLRIEPGRTRGGRRICSSTACRRLWRFGMTIAGCRCSSIPVRTRPSLYRSFRSALTKDEIAELTARDEKTGGAGEIVVRRTEAVRTLRLFVSGRPVNLSNVSLLTTAPEGDARYRDGVLGTDALRPGFTLDFRADAAPPRIVNSCLVA